MSLYSEWNRLLEEQEKEQKFWEAFLVKEKDFQTEALLFLNKF